MTTRCARRSFVEWCKPGAMPLADVGALFQEQRRELEGDCSVSINRIPAPPAERTGTGGTVLSRLAKATLDFGKGTVLTVKLSVTTAFPHPSDCQKMDVLGTFGDINGA